MFFTKRCITAALFLCHPGVLWICRAWLILFSISTIVWQIPPSSEWQQPFTAALFVLQQAETKLPIQ
jgi:hypothetical protein